MTPPISGGRLRRLLAGELEALIALATGLSENDLVQPSGCEGWRVAELLAHLRADAEGLLIGLGGRTESPADRDFVSYWRDWPPEGPATFTGVRFYWAQAASYPSPEGLVGHLSEVAKAAIGACLDARDGRVTFQEHVCEVDDFLAMWVVEFALHHLDLLVAVPDRPGPPDDALELAATTLDAVIGGERPAFWDRSTYVLKGSGRATLTAEEGELLGPAAHGYPAFG